MSNIILSPAHGVNPSVTICIVCGKDDGIALLGRIRRGEDNDAKAPRQIPSNEPCEKCKADMEEHRKLGFMFIVVQDDFDRAKEEDDRRFKPRGVSPWCFFHSYQVVKRDAEFLADYDTSKGAAYICESLARQIGLIK